MALKIHTLDALREFLPENTFEPVAAYLHQYKIHLKLKKDRSTVLGDYRPAHAHQPNTISVNASLNPYHFLLTLLHELAHLLTHEQYGRRVLPHGKEWKRAYAQLISGFISARVFPADIEGALKKTLAAAPASSCSDPVLYRVLKQYDIHPERGEMVEEIGIGNIFRTNKGERFRVLAKRRTRYECIHLGNGHVYLFPGIYEVLAE